MKGLPMISQMRWLRCWVYSDYYDVDPEGGKADGRIRNSGDKVIRCVGGLN